MYKNSVNLTLKKDLCTSCEICKIVCPNNAIKMFFKKGQLIPVIDKNKCINCGICLKLCPGIKNKEYISEKNVFCYVGQTKNKKILLNSASGGLVTTILQHLIKSKKYNCVFLVKEIDYDKKKADFIVTNDLKEIFNSAKSKYIPVSVENIICFLNKQPNKRCVFVGTPCQFLAIKNYIKFKKLNQNNYLFLGLFCEGVLNYNFIDYIKKKFVKKENFLKIDYRNKENYGWPGNLKIYLSNKNKFINRKERTKVKNYFTLTSCYKCNDKFNHFSDISFGDCYIKGKEDKKGVSNIIVRNKKYLYLIPKTIFLEKIDYKKIEDSQIIKKQKPLNFVGKNKFYFLISFLNFLNKIIYIVKIIVRALKKKNVVKKNHVIIVGGGFENKGAFAMLCSITTMLNKSNFKQIIFLTNKNNFNKSNCLKVTPKDKLKILLFENILYNNSKRYKEIIDYLRSAKYMYDVSGFALSSQLNFKTNLFYLFNIFLCKKYNIKMIACPQSIGPLNYPFLYKKIITFFLKQISKIYSREKKYFSEIKKINKNTYYNPDIVLFCKKYSTFLINNKNSNIPKINKNNIGLVLNKRVFEKNKNILKVYYNIFNRYFNKKIYLIKHSAEDDFLKYNSKNITLIDDIYEPHELEMILSQFDVLVASRYHSIIHSYKMGTPCIILGWANKYKELAELFDQKEYYFDCRKKININDILNKLDKLMINQNKESKKIKKRLAQIRKNNKLILK